jgi:hypothetical protein
MRAAHQARQRTENAAVQAIHAIGNVRDGG